MNGTKLNRRQLLTAILIPIMMLTAGCSVLQANESPIQDGPHEITVNYEVDNNQTLDATIASDAGETLLNETFNLSSGGEKYTEEEFTGKPAEINISVGGNTTSHEWPSSDCDEDEFSSVTVQYVPSTDYFDVVGNCISNNFISNGTDSTNSS